MVVDQENSFVRICVKLVFTSSKVETIKSYDRALEGTREFAISQIWLAIYERPPIKGLFVGQFKE